jgi:hypothetical protein
MKRLLLALGPLVIASLAACHRGITPDRDLRTVLLSRVAAEQAQMQELASHWGDSMYQRRMSATLVANGAWLDSIVRRGGWPGFRRVDSSGTHAAFTIAQHADSLPAAQHRFLLALRRAVSAGDASAIDLAYLEDRVRKADGQPQLYGTQPAYDGAGNAIRPDVVAPDSLDARRATVGLAPMAAYLAQMNELNARLRAMQAPKKP